MKKHALVLLAFAVSSHIAASEDQLVSKNDKRDKRTTASDSNLIIPVNKSSSKNITVSANILMLDSPHSNKEIRFSNSLPRSPEVQIRLNCFERHKNSEHNKAFIEKVCNKDNKDYPIYIELIKSCEKCLPIFKQRLSPN